jgi:hypothetical protein
MVTIRDRENSIGELKTIDSIRQHILDGNAYRAWDTSFNLSVDSSMNFAFVVDSSCTAKIKFFVEADQSTNLRMIEDASWNTAGGEIELTAYNFNRNSSNAMSCKLYKAPSMAGKWGAGTVISSKYGFAANTTGGLGRTVFGQNNDEYSMILASGKLYVFNLVNKGPGLGNLAVHMRLTERMV